ncbi:MAG: hypothetical protein ACTSW1_19650 [Candidatus Hodarchaeales archaeon]
MIQAELNSDQKRVISVLKKPSLYLAGQDNGFLGVPYKEIMKNSGLSLEKTLLSLGYLESLGLVKHECAVQRQKVEYLGHTEVELTGQKIVRMFSLTPEGKSILTQDL